MNREFTEKEIDELLEDADEIDSQPWRHGRKVRYVFEHDGVHWAVWVHVHHDEGIQEFGPVTATQVHQVERTMTSAELRRIVGMRNLPWRQGHLENASAFGADGSGVLMCKRPADVGAVAILANHANAFVALVEACEGIMALRDGTHSQSLIDERCHAMAVALAAVHAVGEAT